MKTRQCLAAVLLSLLASAAAIAGSLGPEGTPGRAIPGKFTWYDLATEDPASARAFYGEVFGWKFRDAPGVPSSYAVIENAGSRIGGIFRHARPAGGNVGARWLSLVSVRDPARTELLVKKRGGEVLLAPSFVPGRGVHAVFRDPEGAVFGILASEGGDPPDAPVDDGDFFWLDLFARDPAKAADFYAEIGGYEVAIGEAAGRHRTVLASNGIARAGVAHLPSGAQKPGWLPYVLVSDVPATLARVRKAGGRVVVEPSAAMLDGNLAVIADREGGVLGIVDWIDPAAGGAR
jgi:predicted enzyme related to lactoylglutathione lyase